MTSYLTAILYIKMSTITHLTSLLHAGDLRLTPFHSYVYVPAVIFILQSTLRP